MTTLRKLLDIAFDQRDENWPIVDLDNIGVYCAVESQPTKRQKYIDLYDGNEEVVATFPLDEEMEGSGLWTKGRKEFHFLSVNVLRRITVD